MKEVSPVRSALFLMSFALWASPFILSPASAAPPPKPPVPWPTTQLTFPDKKTITVEVAATPEAREYGLMERESLPKDYGMLFAFPIETGLQFWMKNTLVELDMVFIGKDKRVTVVHHRVPKSSRETPEEQLARRGGLAQYVLELPSGDARRHKLQRGQTLAFELPIPKR